MTEQQEQQKLGAAPLSYLPQQSRERGQWRRWLPAVADQVGLVVVLVALIAAFGATTPYFFTAGQFRTIANQIPATVLVAVGMTYVLIIAGIDLSVGSVLALGGAVIGVVMSRWGHVPFWVAAGAALGAGVLCGLINGVVTVVWDVPSFVVTLGMLEIARGMTHLITGSHTIYLGERVEAFAEIEWLGLSLPFWIAIAVVAIGQIVLTRTVFGRYIVAVGTNEEVVRLSGVSPGPVKVWVFVIAAVLSAAGATIEVSRSQAATPNAGIGLELDVIAAVVIGGTSLMGGRGSVVNSLLGVVIIAVLNAGLAARGVKDETKRLVTGCVIVAAVVLDYYRRRFAMRRG